MPPETLAVFQTGVQYQFYHSLGLILAGILPQRHKESILLTAAGLLMAVGMLLFSGSLYALSTTGIRNLGIITPIGGAAFIAAWLLLAAGICKAEGRFRRGLQPIILRSDTSIRLHNRYCGKRH